MTTRRRAPDATPALLLIGALVVASGILFVGVPAWRGASDTPSGHRGEGAPGHPSDDARPAPAGGVQPSLPRAVVVAFDASDAAFRHGNAIAAVEPLIELWESDGITTELAPIVRERLHRVLVAGAADAHARGDSVRVTRFVGLLGELKRVELIEARSEPDR